MSSAMPATSAREHRQRLVRVLVARYEVTSQTELVDLLAREGVDATQATVSRDLDELGIGKQRGADGRLAYALPEPGGLAQVLRQFATTIDASGNLAVVRTPPGAAAAVASAIDSADLPGVLATVQGDDTLLVVAVEGETGAALAARLSDLKHANPVRAGESVESPAPAEPTGLAEPPASTEPAEPAEPAASRPADDDQELLS